MMKQAVRITNVWFDGDRIVGQAEDGRVLWQSLLYYPRLMNATDEQRSHYEIWQMGISWPELDEDVSFESFEYEDPEPRGVSRLLLSLPELNLSALARRLNIQQSLLAAYKNGTKKPSKERETIIVEEIHKIGRELQSVAL